MHFCDHIFFLILQTSVHQRTTVVLPSQAKPVCLQAKSRVSLLPSIQTLSGWRRTDVKFSTASSSSSSIHCPISSFSRSWSRKPMTHPVYANPAPHFFLSLSDCCPLPHQAVCSCVSTFWLCCLPQEQAVIFRDSAVQSLLCSTCSSIVRTPPLGQGDDCRLRDLLCDCHAWVLSHCICQSLDALDITDLSNAFDLNHPVTILVQDLRFFRCRCDCLMWS